MTYNLTFLKSAKKEWGKLTPSIQKQLKEKLSKRLDSPFIQKDKLRGMRDCYKIKLRSSGYRLVYKVFEKRIVVQVIAIGKRSREAVYHLARERLE